MDFTGGDMDISIELMVRLTGLVINGEYRRQSAGFVPAYCCNPRYSIDVLTPGTEKV